MLSTTTAPALTAYGAYLADVEPPAEREQYQLLQSCFSRFFNRNILVFKFQSLAC